MQSKNRITSDEIDLFNVLEILWTGKWVVGVFLVLFLGLGLVVIQLSPVRFESRMIYTIDVLPPFYQEQKVHNDFRKMFLSESVFLTWKKNQSSLNITAEQVFNSQTVNDVPISRGIDAQLVELIDRKSHPTYIAVRTNDLPLLSYIYKYASFVSKLLQEEYVRVASHQLVKIDAKLRGSDQSENMVMERLFEVEQYITSSEYASGAMFIRNPTKPERVSSSKRRTLAIFLVLGGIIGVLVVLVRNALSNRNYSQRIE